MSYREGGGERVESKGRLCEGMLWNGREGGDRDVTGTAALDVIAHSPILSYSEKFFLKIYSA